MSGTTSNAPSPSITFLQYPQSNRDPGFFAEITTSRSNSTTFNLRAIVVGQAILNGTTSLTPGVPTLAPSTAFVAATCGVNSVLTNMVMRYRQSDTFGELWILPIADASGATPATGSVALFGTATSGGTLSLYVAGKLVSTAVSQGDTAAVVAENVIAQLPSAPQLPVTYTAAGGTIAFTAANAGPVGNDISLQVNYLGAAGGEAIPAGLSVTITAMNGGAVPPTANMTAALANLTNAAVEFYAFGFNDTASLNQVEAFLNDTVGRWSWQQMLYGGAFSAYRSTIAGLQTFGTSRNDPSLSLQGIYDDPEPFWEWAADICAVAAISVRADPALPFNGRALSVLPGAVQNRFPVQARNTLLYSGISTHKVDDANQVFIDRLITTAQTNASGVPDDSYLSMETRFQLPYVIRDLKTYVLSLYGVGKILVSDTTRVSTNPNVVTPAMIKASVISRYRYLEAAGEVQNGDAFAASLRVQNKGNGLVAIYWPGDLANQLNQFAVQIAFAKP